MPEGRRPRGVTPRPRSGAVAQSARLRWRRIGREELPSVQGQGGRPRGATPHPRSGAAAERSYPAPPSLKPGAAAGRSYLVSKVRGRGREDQPHAWGQGRPPEGPTPHPRSRGCAGVGGPKELSHIEGQEGRQWGIPLVQGKEQRLCFAGAAVKRYPTPKVRETQVRR